MNAPLCLWCGRAIRKRTAEHFVSHSDEHAPTCKADCQARTNGQVVSVRYWRTGRVMAFSTWDGESYDDPHFCTRGCAERYGRRCARRLAELGEI